MNAKILNRAVGAEKSWHQIEVSGAHPAGKLGVQVIDLAAKNAIVANFAKRKASML